MDTPFGIPWERIGEDELRAFLADDPEEGLTWEAKGDDDQGSFPRDRFRDAVAGLANGLEVAYVVVGASWSKGRKRWSLRGLRDVPGGEIASWLDQLIDEVTPKPRVVIKPLKGDDGPAAVVQVFPLPVPPAMHRGRLLVRTSGRTVHLTDPIEVRRLVERGERAIERARSDAVAAAHVSRAMPFESPYSPSVTIGLASTGRRVDVDRQVFRESFGEQIRDMFGRWEVRPLGRRKLKRQMWHDRVAVWKQDDHGSQAGAMTSGAAFVTWWSGAERDRGLDFAIEGLLDRMWLFAGEIVTELGGSGPSFAYVQVNMPGSVVDLTRTTAAPVPSSREIAEGRRYLARRRGDEVFEPEEAVDDTGRLQPPIQVATPIQA